MPKFETLEQAMRYCDDLSLTQLKMLAAEKLMQGGDNSKIVVTEEQMSKICNLFKIRGMTENGEVERRGRKKKS